MKESPMDLINEVISEDMEALREVIEEAFMPLIKHHQEMEKKAFDKAYEDLMELERSS